MRMTTAIMLGVVAVAAGCTTAAKKVGGGAMGGNGVGTATVECVFPDARNEPAPAWVCDRPVDGVALSAVGAYEKTGAGIGFQQGQALADARVKLAQQMRVRVANLVKQYAETTGAASTETVDKVNSSVSKLITIETLTGSRLRASTANSIGTIYVLVGLDPQGTRALAQQALTSSMRNDRALWQQFKADKAQEELAAEIAKGVANE